MSQLLRRVRRSNANRIALTGLLGIGVGVPAAGGSPSSTGNTAQQPCAGATARREYTADAMTFRLRLDLDGCRWWDGSPRNLVIYVSRDDDTGPASRYSMIPCDAGTDPNARTTFCEVFTTVHHPAEEKAATYQGEATWQWQDGERRVSFETRCSTTKGQARCDDPVDTWHQ
jgi:hypothetical protein